MKDKREGLKQKKQMIILVLLACLGVYGLNYMCSLSVTYYFSNSLLSLLVFIVILGLLYYTTLDIQKITDKRKKRCRIGYSLVTAFLMALTMIAGWQLQTRGMTESGFKGKGVLILYSLCLAIVLFPFTNLLFKTCVPLMEKKIKEPDKRWKCIPLFFVCLVIIMLCFLPVFLAYYPGIMGYDFNIQSIQAMGELKHFSAHHPMAHTWLIWVAFRLGEMVGSYQTGMAFYSVFQMLLLSAAYAYMCVTIYRLTGRRGAVVLTVLFLGLFPYHSILAVSVTKDVIFGALFVVFVLLWIERCFWAIGKRAAVINVLLVIEGCVMMLFRNNAFYALVAFSFLAVLLCKGKERMWTLLLCAVILIGGQLSFWGVRTALGSESMEVQSEKYSVLMQQFARVGYFHKEDMDEATREIINKYVYEEYWENYNPPLADSIKIFVAGGGNYGDAWAGKLSEVLEAWATVGMKYPNEYIDAFAQLTRGYWFIDDVSFAYVYDFEEDRKGVLPTFNGSLSSVLPEGIANESMLPELKEALEELVQENACFEYPVLSLLFKPAFYCWILVLLAFLCLYTRQTQKLIIMALPLTYLLTLLLGPVVQVRYIFPFIATMPVLLAVVLSGEKESALTFKTEAGDRKAK